MLGIDQAIILIGSEDRGHEQQTALSSLREFIAYPGEVRRSRGFTPVRGQMAGFNPVSRHAVWNLRNG